MHPVICSIARKLYLERSHPDHNVKVDADRDARAPRGRVALLYDKEIIELKHDTQRQKMEPLISLIDTNYEEKFVTIRVISGYSSPCLCVSVVFFFLFTCAVLYANITSDKMTIASEFL